MNAASVQFMQPGMLEQAAVRLHQAGGRMEMLYGLTRDSGQLELRYVTAPQGALRFDIWRLQPDGEVPSLANIWPLLGWYEREVMDLHELRFANHPEPYPLLRTSGEDARADLRRVPEIENKLVQSLPFGPVRAGVVESAEFTFFYVGEAIIHYQPHLFFKHRGMEQRFAGRDIDTGTVFAERVSGVGSLAHALAYSQAVETACGTVVPERARYWRVVFAELERLYNHLYYLGHLADTTTLKVGHAEGVLLAEQVKQINARFTGSRFLRGLVAPGGLRRDLDTQGLPEALDRLHDPIRRYIARLRASASYFDRLSTTGHLPSEIAFDQGATGPIARASGLDRDLRRDHPYAAYDDPDVHLEVAGQTDGDAQARAQVRVAEIDASIAMIQRALAVMPDGAVRAPCFAVPLSEALGWSESPRGTLIYAVHFDSDGRLARVKIKSPSFSNWRVFPSTVHDTNMMDYAINEASFGLTISGCAR